MPRAAFPLNTGGSTWTVEVGQPWRNKRAGLEDGLLREGVKITVNSHRHADPAICTYDLTHRRIKPRP